MVFLTKSNQQNAAEDPTSPAGQTAESVEEEVDNTPEPEENDRKEEASRPAPGRAAASGPGFATIYKKGQGYWTRMGTAIGIGVIAAFTAYNLYYYIPTFLTNVSEGTANRIGVIVGIVTLLGLAGLGFWLTNRPDNVDFLIATDSEMKKVNWTSRRELIGSTRVVILFMFIVTLFLFTVDIIFGYLFHVANVLQSGPFGG